MTDYHGFHRLGAMMRFVLTKVEVHMLEESLNIWKLAGSASDDVPTALLLVLLRL